MNTKVIVAILIVTAIGMTITPAIFDTAFSEKNGKPNENSQKVCEKNSNPKKCPPPQDEDDDEDNGGGGII